MKCMLFAAAVFTAVVELAVETIVKMLFSPFCSLFDMETTFTVCPSGGFVVGFKRIVCMCSTRLESASACFHQLTNFV